MLLLLLFLFCCCCCCCCSALYMFQLCSLVNIKYMYS